MNASTEIARSVVDALLASGVTDAVLAPGSRSSPLALALHAADQAGLVRLHVRIDERTAGFLALGLAKASHRVVPVVTTSGTAVANLHPAILEAKHAHVQVLAITADRPARLRGTGANQTTDQIKFFRGVPYAQLSAPSDDVAAIMGELISSTRGSAQLNIEFDDPLLPPDDGWVPVPNHELVTYRGASRETFEIAQGPRTVVLAGDNAGRAARRLAEAGGWPLLAEPSSGSRTGRNALQTYRLILASDLAQRVERVVVFGHPTLSRPVTTLLSRDDVEVIVVGEDLSGFPLPARFAQQLVDEVVVDECDGPEWLDAWRAADAKLVAGIADVLAAEPSLSPLEVAAEVAGALPPEGLLVVGSSNPIRDLDLMMAPTPLGEKRLTLANRGLAGIDGTISTAIGAALARTSSRAIAYLGDLTFLHDANGLLIGPLEPRPDLTIVVASDDGGSIFSTLEPGEDTYAPAFERVFGTPTRAHIGHLCAAYGIPHMRVATSEALREALGQAPDGIRVVEAMLDRTRRRALTSAINGLALR
ncbi:2-succinyl-5-enolpyruvyl-6-hydroxy-3-cyclohexene-1-carboxylic-acid synthase [soil metagenome]